MTSTAPIVKHELGSTTVFIKEEVIEDLDTKPESLEAIVQNIKEEPEIQAPYDVQIKAEVIRQEALHVKSEWPGEQMEEKHVAEYGEEASYDTPDLVTLDALETECNIQIKGKARVKQTKKEPRLNWLTFLRDKNGILECMACHYKTSSRAYFARHVFNVHTSGDESFECQECLFKTTTKFKLTRHVKMQHSIIKNTYKCQHCSYETKWNYILRNHVASIHDDNYEGYLCSYCGHKTKWKTNLLKHMKLVHKTTDVENTELEGRKRQRKILENTNNIGFTCLFCDHKTKWKGSMTKHVKLKHDINSELYYCEHCSYFTKDKHRMKIHTTAIHDTTAQVYDCQLCSFKTKEKTRLRQHVKMMHDENAETMHCARCSYSTKVKKYLLAHIRNSHRSSDVYKCPLCDFKTRWRWALGRHNDNVHDLDRTTFRCSACKFKSKDEYRFKRHLRMRHIEDGETSTATDADLNTT